MFHVFQSIGMFPYIYYILIIIYIERENASNKNKHDTPINLGYYNEAVGCINLGYYNEAVVSHMLVVFHQSHTGLAPSPDCIQQAAYASMPSHEGKTCLQEDLNLGEGNNNTPVNQPTNLNCLYIIIMVVATSVGTLINYHESC